MSATKRRTTTRTTAPRETATIRPTAGTSARGADPIRHVVVLMMENRSFDHYLGAYQAVRPAINGIAPGAPPRSNKDSLGNPYEQLSSTAPTTTRDLPHENKHVLRQLENSNTGFVLAYEDRYKTAQPPPTPQEFREVMSYFPVGSLPAIDLLARHFLICDHWYASVPGSTWTNRFFVHSGTSQGRVKMPEGPLHLHLHAYHQDTIYDRLNLRKIGNKKTPIPWRIFFGDVPQSLLLSHQYKSIRNAQRYDKMPRFFRYARGSEAGFPQYSFIEPNYFGANQNDDHPSVDVMKGQQLIADVYNALRANDALWRSTLLVIVYDEHGGFYDHVTPPPAPPPDHDQSEYTFDRFGVRVPALLISPYVKADVLSTPLDHTSILRYVADKWALADLGDRMRTANSFASAIQAVAREDTPERITMPAPARARAMAPARAPNAPLTDFQRSLVALTDVLERELPDEPAKVRRYARTIEGPQAQERVAIERVNRFLATRKGTTARSNHVTKRARTAPQVGVKRAKTARRSPRAAKRKPPRDR